ncbi:MAG: PAS domain S-box protein [Anaerolineaceae bacterium]|nr:MAG: PAS domain S-box protein [Anaerolineaceae bacterium]
MLEDILTKARILIVDDQETNNYLLESILALNGYNHYKSLTDPRQVLGLYAEYQPDLILLDLMMPHMDGFAVMEGLRSLIPANTYLPILVLTADVTAETKRRALSSGAIDFLTKPLDTVEVMLRIRNLLETRFLHLQLQNQNQILEQKVLERTAQLTESEAKHRILIEQIPAITYIDDSAAGPGKTRFVSQQVEQLLGITPEEWIKGGYELWSQTIHSEDRERVLADYLRHFESGEPFECEYRLLARDGRIVWIHDSSRMMRDEADHPHLVHGLMLDITARKQAETALARRAEELAALQATVLEITASHDLSSLLQTIVERAAYLLQADGGGLYLCDPEKQETRCVVSYNTIQDYTGTVLKYGEGAAGTIAQSGKPLIIDDYRSWSGGAEVYKKDQPFRALVSVPMLWQGQVTGVLHALRTVEDNPFTQADLDFLTLFANHAAIAVENTRLLDGLLLELKERKQAEAVVEEQAERFRTMLSTITEGFWLVDDQGRLVDVNQAYCQMSAYSKDELLTLSIPDLEAAETFEATAEHIQTIIETGSDRFETMHKTKDGRVFDVEISAVFWPARRQFFVFIQDISKRKQVERELKAQKEFAFQVMNTMGEGLTVTGAEGNYEYVNSTYARMLGYSSQQLMGRHPLEFTAHEDQAAHAQAWIQRARGETSAYEVRLQRADGTIFPAAITGAPRIQDGKFSGSIAVVTDLTERKEAESLLRLQSTAMNAAANGIIITDEQGVIQWVNPAFIDITGYSAKEVIGQTPAILKSGLHDQAYYKNMWDTILSGEIWSGEMIDRYKDGSLHISQSTITPVKNERGEIVNFIEIKLDITERKQTEEALKISQAGLEEAQRIAHLGSWEWDPVTDIPTWSKELCAILEVDPNQPVPSVAEQDKLYTPESMIRMRSGIEQAMGGTPYEIELERVREDGTRKWLLARGEPRLDKDGSIIGLRGTALDITERKQAEQALQQRARELQTLYETSLEINAQTSLDALLSSIVERSASLLDTDSGGLYLMEPDGKSLKLAVCHNLPEEFIGLKLAIGEGLSGQVAQSGKPMYVDDYQTWTGRTKVYDGTSFRRVLGIPLKIKEIVIGVINVSDLTHTGSFTEDQVRLVTLFADQAALAIESARLIEQEHKRNRELATLYESAMTISSNLSLEIVLKTVAEQVSRAVNTNGCTVSFWDQERDTLTTMGDYRTISSELADMPGTTYALKDYPATRRVLETRQPLLESLLDPQANAAELTLMQKLDMSTVLLLPLVARDRVIGLMEIYEVKNKERVFTEDEIRLAQSLSAQTAIFIDNARLFEQAERRLHRTEALHKIDIAIAGSVDVNVIFNVILDQAFAQLGMDAIGVLLFDPVTQVLQYAAGRGFRTKALQETHLPLGQGYAGRAALERKTIHISELQTRKTDFLRSPSFSQEEFVSYYGVPLVAKGQIKGVLEIFHRTAFEAEAEWLDFLETLAGQTAIAIDNADLFKDLQLSNIELTLAYEATIEGWSHAMDLRDKETQDHTLRVTEMTEGLARALGVGDSDLVHIRRGALLHDIGKMGVPDSVLLKAGKLTDEEWELMRRHPQFAYDMLSPISYLRPAMDIPYCHHEKWDGTGYPRNLKGEQIPLAARLFAVIDVYDALTSDRPYRKAWSKKKTLEYIKEQSGIHFDPAVVDAFLKSKVIAPKKKKKT